MSDRNRGPDADAGAAPLVMIVDGQEWSGRALESILLPAGYRVHRAHTHGTALNDAAVFAPDAILIDLGPEHIGLDLCRRLIASPRVGPATPLIVTAADLDARLLRLDALRAGAWEYLELPPAVDELLARLETWIRAKRAVDQARDASLLDVETGFYNARGLEMRAVELAAEAARFGTPLSCVVFTVEVGVGVPGGWCPPHDFFDHVRATLDRTLRTSDAIGRLSAGQFAVLAPATDPGGARRLAERVLEAVDRLIEAGLVPGRPSPPSLHAGYYGVLDISDALLEPGELLARAVSAGDEASDAVRIRAYGRPTYH